jgi:peptidoglycan/LPS O-acetylase OafA/YrhL
VTTASAAERTSFGTPPDPKGSVAGPIDLSPHNPSKRHLPALDGVRAIAIVMVIIYHSVTGSPGMTPAQLLFLRVAGQGWMGVDLFFVLSGFLITGILLDIRNPGHALRNFYARRALRIVPVYVVFMIFSLFVAGAVGTMRPSEIAQLQQTQAWYWTYTLNILVALHGWHVTNFPMAHLWSLAVEEQFYLLWPFAVLVLSPAAVRRTALGCIVAAELCRLAFILGGAEGQVNYALLPTRMDSLAAGAFLACAFRDRELWARVLRYRLVVAGIALLMVVAAVIHRPIVDSQQPFEQLVLLPAIVALASVVIASAAQGVAWLSGAGLRFIGKISYGMYLWHLVAMRLLLMIVPVPNTPLPEAWWVFYVEMIIGTFAGAVMLASVSWYAIEQPFLRMKRRVPNE